MSPPLRIAIIGAGPGGTCLARILSQSSLLSGANPAIALTVFEGETSLNVRSQGGTLDLRQDTGLEAIRAANLMNEFEKYARYDGESLIICDKHFTKWIVQVGDKNDKNAHAPEIDRFRLRQLLLDSLPERIITWGKRLVKVEGEEDGKQTLHFRDGTSEGGFDLVVGADGTWSKVRPAVSQAVPKFSGVAGWAFTISNASKVCPNVVDLIKGGSMMSPHDRQFLSVQQMGDDAIQCTMFFLPEDGDEKWVEKAEYDTKNPEEVRDWVLKEKMATWNPALREALEKLGNDNTQIQPWTLYELPIGHSWEHHKGVTILGDGAHVMTPFAGEGVNQALTDATVLGKEIIKAVEARKVAGEKDLAAALDGAVLAYEKEMFVRMADKMENTRKMKEITLKEGGLYKNAEMWITTAVEDNLPMRWLTRPVVSALAHTYFFFWRLWNQPKP